MRKKPTPSPPSSDKPGSTTPRVAAKEITSVVFGGQLIAPWYPSSYPSKLLGDASFKNGRLYVCEHCFKYTPDVARALGHQKFCTLARGEMLGTLMYSHGGCDIYEVDGAEEPLFCQSLSLFAKFFLDTKGVCYETRSFLFYTLIGTCGTTGRKRVLGFFSKEKISWDDYNLACILVFPPFQKKGLGKLLIAFSYELSRGAGKMGSPEKPLSDLGHKGYIAYWSTCIAKVIRDSEKDSISINDLSKATYIQPDDIKAALDSMGVIQMDRWRHEVDEAYTINPEGMMVRQC
ncbi:acyl-CoA N-acyltransferase [Tricharina praecox]|uniref:acyl-CoA N-acyltransferase n=1 Tax=Tricharina praecox TaxID=43433 RepID=UPI002220F2AA|nr:acyl-CoA N-acyltransferase [Tricharina praecox]KAI5855230.1 acyl-CoA N-acyltransferase [Tricharina praecox]